MATGPRDPMAQGAAGRGRIRASDADREQVIDALKIAFVQGRITKDELSERTGHALGSRTYAELTAIIADLARPGRSRPVRLPQPARPARPPARSGPRTPASRRPAVWAASAIVLTPALGAAFLTFYGGFLVLLVFAFIGAVVTAPPRAPS